MNSEFKILSAYHARKWLRENKVESKLPRALRPLLIFDPPTLPGYHVRIERLAAPQSPAGYRFIPIPNPMQAAA